ncbi:siderophore-iron reductase FhuF [Halomonas sp. NO4]|uniref:siderophore-iron reductase FhuF n=1 Tax=Halomonas sp. NO4 TaxID=2484813 RepID=UPI0013D2EE83|nr:siderophore-iron reductase FhuF [Halomonas sp. NO4]
MSALLASLYRGPLAAMTPPSLGHDDPALSPARHLSDAAWLDTLLERFASRYPGGDPRAVASLWSKWHFSALLAPGLAANLLLSRDLPLDLERTGLHQTEDGQTERLAIADEGEPLASGALARRFSTLLDGHLAPLIDTLASCSGASPRVFWSNAGNVFEHFAHAISTHPLARPDSAKPAFELLERRQLADGRRNPLYQPVRYHDPSDGQSQRVRRMCCIRYLIDDLGYCGNCPLEVCRQKARSA